MKTDKQIFWIFASHPRWIFDLTGLPWPGPCQMKSVSLEAIEQIADGIIYPDLLSAPLTVVEFQFQSDATIYTRIVIEMALAQQANSMRDVQGIIFFFDSSLDPTTEPWKNVVHVYYLDVLIDELGKRQPDHPLVAVFQPVMLRSSEKLEKEARKYYNQIKSSGLPEETLGRLLDIFVNWLEQRFSSKGKEEIEKMLIGSLPDLRETQSGKDLIHIGRMEGRNEGKIEGEIEGEIKGKIESLFLVLNSRFGQLDPKLQERIEQISAIEEVDRALLRALQITSIDELTF